MAQAEALPKIKTSGQSMAELVQQQKGDETVGLLRQLVAINKKNSLAENIKKGFAESAKSRLFGLKEDQRRTTFLEKLITGKGTTGKTDTAISSLRSRIDHLSKVIDRSSGPEKQRLELIKRAAEDKLRRAQLEKQMLASKNEVEALLSHKAFLDGDQKRTLRAELAKRREELAFVRDRKVSDREALTAFRSMTDSLQEVSQTMKEPEGAGVTKVRIVGDDTKNNTQQVAFERVLGGDTGTVKQAVMGENGWTLAELMKDKTFDWRAFNEGLESAIAEELRNIPEDQLEEAIAKVMKSFEESGIGELIAGLEVVIDQNGKALVKTESLEQALERIYGKQSDTADAIDKLIETEEQIAERNARLAEEQKLQKQPRTSVPIMPRKAKGGIFDFAGFGVLAAGMAAAGGIAASIGAVLLRTTKVVGRAFGFFGSILDGILGFFKASEWGTSRTAGVIGAVVGGTDKGLLNVFLNAGKWAALGATIGSVVPVVGTIAGGLLGAAFGAIMGWVGGEGVAKFVDSSKEFIGKMWDGALAAFKAMDDFGIELGKWVREKIDAGKTFIRDSIDAVLKLFTAEYWEPIFESAKTTVKGFYEDLKTKITDFFKKMFSWDYWMGREPAPNAAAGPTEQQQRAMRDAGIDPSSLPTAARAAISPTPLFDARQRQSFREGVADQNAERERQLRSGAGAAIVAPSTTTVNNGRSYNILGGSSPYNSDPSIGWPRGSLAGSR